MAANQPRRRGRPAKLSRDSILAAALSVLDREGADALTMRRLGAELGVEAMSLYRHFDDRAALLAALADRLAAEIAPNPCGDDWAEALRELAGALRALARAHPAAFALLSAQVLRAPAALPAIEEVLASLRRGGFTPARAVLAYRITLSYARGYALCELEGFALALAPDVPLAAIRAHGRRLASEPSDSSFRAGIETIVAGLRREL